MASFPIKSLSFVVSTREFDTKALRKSSYVAMPKCGGGRFASILRPAGRRWPERNVSNLRLTPLAAADVSWIGW